MRCQCCGAPAAVAPEHEQVSVGLCAEHVRAYMAALEEAPALRALDPTDEGP